MSSTEEVKPRLTVYEAGTDDEKDLLLNPAHVLVAKEKNLLDAEIGKAFTEWVGLYDA